jgi:hypothetical protein
LAEAKAALFSEQAASASMASSLAEMSSERDKLIAQCVDITFRYGQMASELDEASAVQGDLAARLEAETARCTELAAKSDQLAAQRDELAARCAELTARSPGDLPSRNVGLSSPGDELSSLRADLMAERSRSAELSTQRRRLEVELNMALSENGHWRRRALTAEGHLTVPAVGSPSVTTALRKTMPPLRPPPLPVRPRGAVADKRRDAKGQPPARVTDRARSAALFDPILQQARRVRTWLTAATIAVGLAARRLFDNFMRLARSAPSPSLPKPAVPRLPGAVDGALSPVAPVSKAELPTNGRESRVRTSPEDGAGGDANKEAQGETASSPKKEAGSKGLLVAALQDVPKGPPADGPETNSTIFGDAAANGNARVARLSSGLRETARRLAEQVQGRDPNESSGQAG